MSDVLKFGALIVNGTPVLPGAAFESGSEISFSDAVPGYELLWLPIPGTKSLVAQSTLITNISWRQLRDLGFVDGKPFVMDDKLYFVRLPWLGTSSDAKNELEGIPNNGLCCWGRETFISFERKKPEQRSTVYGSLDNVWLSAHPATLRPDLGFRPVIDSSLNM